MLLQLSIRNFALIENITVNFEQGFNVLLGETGAGKSILIDAINYVLGGKFEKNLIRIGEEKTYVEAVFTIENLNTKEMLSGFDIDYDDDVIIISRETFKSGKNIAKVNGKSLIVSQLKMLASTLLDIHGQHKNQNLLDESNYISYIDSFGKERVEDKLHTYSKYYNEIKEIDKQIKYLRGNEEDKDKIADFIKYQIDEINKANLKLDEDVILEESFKKLSNYEKLNNSISQSYELINSSEDNNLGIFDGIGLVVKNLREVEFSSEKIKKLADSLEEIYYNIENISHDIRDIGEDLYYDKDELEDINKRMYEIDNYKRKYGKTIIDILDYRDKLIEKYDEIINLQENIDKLFKDKEKIIGKMDIIASNLHDIRCGVAKELESKVMSELSYVGLEKANFKIQVNYSGEYGEKGKDSIEFLISTNPGQPLKELFKIVSGGELSRIMLSLKAVFIDKDKIPSVIFDEIDTGISGRIAESVGEKMYKVSSKHQVFCITHLPQIAVMSDHHYLVKKNVVENKTFSSITKITENQKVEEIAKMLSGANLTKSALENSRELIGNANKKKFMVCKN
ncbi:DNA repair protein RecN [Haloimpatiens sp. FM7315]|uniref:DNA repair protein RecN n=1 Tax=Haloimpatiens sp. FM7315 TaxID=3298609 RepID=UPI00370A80BA